MTRILVFVLLAVFVGMGLATQTAAVQEKTEKTEKKVAQKEVRWHGTIVRMDKEESTLTVRRQGVDKVVYFDSATRWTRGTKTIDPSEFKDTATVICMGKYDEKGLFRATRIDLRRQ